MYPAFVNCTTIDWFSEWPNDALLEVAEKYLEAMDLGAEEVGALSQLIFDYFQVNVIKSLDLEEISQSSLKNILLSLRNKLVSRLVWVFVYLRFFWLCFRPKLILQRSL